MGILRSEGFAALVDNVARQCAESAAAVAAARFAASLGGRVPTEIGMAALTRPEARLLAAAEADGARLVAGQDVGDRLGLTTTGRLRLFRAGQGLADDTHLIGAIGWSRPVPDEVAAEIASLAEQERQEAADLKSWLDALPRARVDDMIERVRFSLRHMAPVLLYTGTGCYTNLGKKSNLVGKSLRADSPRCLLNTLSATPVADWSARDACFLACVHALLLSGPAVRAEEFSGTQLRPERLELFLRRRLARYGAVEPDTRGLPHGERLHVLARACASGRARLVDSGVRPYRVIRGVNLNKQEHLSDEPVRPTDVPAAVLAEFTLHFGRTSSSDFAELGAACATTIAELHRRPGREGFGSAFEQVLHDLVLVATEATASDVGMTRGPRRVGELIRLTRQGGVEATNWKTGDFFCCVTPSQSFVERFAHVPEELPPVLRAISARMRYNGWHYLPHTIGVHERCERQDWFFAPTMSDVTDWSDQHHTGHVANGVRHAIRVPFGVNFTGAHRPGLHDFRLMRVEGEPYTLSELRAAIAVGELLRCLYQAHAGRLEREKSANLDIVDFDNSWYQNRYAQVRHTSAKEEARA